MSELLDRIDRAVDGLCPCGADPAPGSAYCGDDCTPTHLAGDTDTSHAGQYGAQSTAMRWRPDLVTAHDDSGLEKIPTVPGIGVAYGGRHNGTLYSRSHSTWHLRLDDGHRYVGMDVEINHVRDADGATVLDAATVDRIWNGWQRLERELGNSRHLEPNTDLWADAFAAVLDSMLVRADRHMQEDLSWVDQIFARTDGEPAVTYPFAAAPTAEAPTASASVAGGTLVFGDEDRPLLDAIIMAQSEAALRVRARTYAPSDRLLWWTPPVMDARSILRNVTVT